jgi:demethoxyubiquinone hydroxylase (CLK1/Coq7/Cat5 family)
VKTGLFFGYRLAEISPGQRAFIALPEKALLDLIHLHAGGDEPAYLAELRLQNLDHLDLAVLRELAEQTASPKLQRAAAIVARLAHIEAKEYEEL